MNYLLEIKLFYDWLETHKLSADGIAVWHALMHIASRSGWSESLHIPLSALELRARVTRAAIYRERTRLQDFGLISFFSRGGRACCVYMINSFVSQIDKQSESQADLESQLVSQIDKQDDLELQFVSQIDKQTDTIYKLNYNIDS